MAPSCVGGKNLLSCMHVSAWKLPDKREVMSVNQPQRTVEPEDGPVCHASLDPCTDLLQHFLPLSRKTLKWEALFPRIEIKQQSCDKVPSSSLREIGHSRRSPPTFSRHHLSCSVTGLITVVCILFVPSLLTADYSRSEALNI